MDEQQAHDLYQHLKSTDASAKQKRGLGFSAPSSALHLTARTRTVGDSGLTGFKRARSSSSERQRDRDRSSHQRSKRSPDRSKERKHGAGRQEETFSERRAGNRKHQEADVRHHSREKYYDGRDREEYRTERSRHSHRVTNRPEKGGQAPYRDKRRSDAGNVEHSSTDLTTSIPGYADLSPAEKLKARTKFQLQKHSEEPDSRSSGSQWTRFVFNKALKMARDKGTAAPLMMLMRPDQAGLREQPQQGLLKTHQGIQLPSKKPDNATANSLKDGIDTMVTANQANLDWRQRAAQLRERRQQALAQH